jgi:hypothetical protein
LGCPEERNEAGEEVHRVLDRSWKSKKKVLEDKLDQLDDQKDRAKDSLKRKWGDD